jgi:hypothetical protein
MIVPGVFIRQFICKPITELDDSELFQNFKNFDIFKSLSSEGFNDVDGINHKLDIELDIKSRISIRDLKEMNFKKVINDCEMSGHSDQIDKLVHSVIPTFWNPKTEIGLAEIRNKIMSIVKDNPLHNYVSDARYNARVREKFLPDTMQLFQNKFDLAIREIPFCSVLTFFYDIVKSPCLNLVDNFNLFWATLIVCYLINIIIVIFAILQSDLFRKYYSYSESLKDEM